ncbi:hypothetical protein PICMEDRAFT_73491 [Pichia membranifaciens NRRL Y-2026]|uniref:Uncharacterized protein n=1 Tax=Pichia membranifaciens NRRL Y-2026 TaxID=763406 RepID=A0A1E3NIW9_9ASCO|nr:hypothetical protein PICMEDRAFT_73491 [Pichia membranifaciens NRRL Y-2026]ODQ46016.1 hypothetical protein PICMEDRAFT_73491 [Pichia membranifaciens NRRL Y-2026]
MTAEWYPREDVPRRYRQWAADYDKSATLQSYKQLKSSAKYLYSKFKTNAAEEPVDVVVCPKPDHPESGTLSVRLGCAGEVYQIADNGARVDVLDWRSHRGTSKDSPSMEERPLYCCKSISVPNYHLPMSSVPYKPDFAFPLHHSRYPESTSLLYTIPTSEKTHQLCFLRNVWPDKYSIKKMAFMLSNENDYTWCSVDSEEYFVLFDKTNSELHVFDSETLLSVGKYSVEVCNSNPVFDLRGSVLMYVPRADKNIEKKNLTPVDLSSKKNLLNKLIITFSNTALDSMFLFSEVTQQKIKNILEAHKKGESADNTDTDSLTDGKSAKGSSQDNEKLKDNYRDIFTEIYNTISKTSAYVCAVDLETKKQMFQLSIPAGCSKLSISPFDLQFLTANNRGDEIFLWDYTKAYDSIVLMDKYNRGKTSAIIEQLEWGTGNSSILCLSRQNGSLHYFVNESLRNYEDLKVRKTKRRNKSLSGSASNGISNSGKSVGSSSWCLSHLKLKSFKVVRSLLTKDFIVALGQNNEILTIDIETGCVDGVINLERKLFQSSPSNSFQGESSNIESELLNQEIEVETCKPFLPAYNNKKYKFTEIKVSIADANVFNDIDSHTDVVKEYNVAGILFMNKMQAKKLAFEGHEASQHLFGNTLRDPSKETLVLSHGDNTVEEDHSKSSHGSSSETLREAASQTLQKAC